MKRRYVLAEKARKDIVCRVPRLLRDGRLDAAQRCLTKHGSARSSPLLLAFSVELDTARGDLETAASLYESRDETLRAALEAGPDEVPEFFIQLFALRLARRDLPAAEEVLRDGKRYGVGEPAYGLLWAKYCDLSGMVDEGLACLKANLPRSKRLADSERSFLVERYPALAADPRFFELLDGLARDRSV